MDFSCMGAKEMQGDAAWSFITGLALNSPIETHNVYGYLQIQEKYLSCKLRHWKQHAPEGLIAIASLANSTLWQEASKDKLKLFLEFHLRVLTK